MRLPRPRFTVRRMMIAVAVVALLVGSEMTRRRWAYFRAIAHSYAGAEEFDRFLLGGGTAIVRMEDGQVSEIHGPLSFRSGAEGGGSIEVTGDPSPGYDAESLRRRADYHAQLRRKYERAARYPWLAVVPDPPKPR